MKKRTALFLAALLCMNLAACGAKPDAAENTPVIVIEGGENGQTAEPAEQGSGSENTAAPEETPGASPEEPQLSIDLTGPWHLDSEKNDLAAFADRFPGYGEWGASMEIRSDGRISWYIGAEGWQGSFVVEGKLLRAQLRSDMDESSLDMDIRISTENEEAALEMDYGDLTLFWLFGEEES